jgi:hypothetical protein
LRTTDGRMYTAPPPPRADFTGVGAGTTRAGSCHYIAFSAMRAFARQQTPALFRGAPLRKKFSAVKLRKLG